MQISELNDAERAWLKVHLEMAKSLAEAYAGAPAHAALTPEGLDLAWSSWIETADREPAAANTIVNATGSALGQFLVDTAGFRWVVASDNHGVEIAIIALEGTANLMVYPMNLVAKRYETGDQGFISPLIERIREQVTVARSSF